MDKTYWTNLIILTIIIIAIILMVVNTEDNSVTDNNRTKIRPTDYWNVAEPFTVDYFMLNGKLAPELESPLERIGRQIDE